MKITERRLKEIIRQEISRINEEILEKKKKNKNTKKKKIRQPRGLPYYLYHNTDYDYEDYDYGLDFDGDFGGGDFGGGE